jgi:UDP-N-acetylenolpyruvoylglucosamine reductase
MLIAANDALKIALIKLQMLHNAKLSKSEQMLVHAASGSSFDKLIADMKAEAASKQQAW